MCSRFTMTFTDEELAQFLGVPEIDAAVRLPRYNVAPSQTVPVLRRAEGGGVEVAGLRWGLVPRWAGSGSHAATGFINARWETAGEKPAFREAANRRRCAIPASGFIEWSAVGRSKQPHWFRWQGGKPFLFAALWEPGEPETAAVLTQSANGDLQEFHERMPVILPATSLEEWLNPGNDWNAVQPLLPAWPAGTISQTAVNPKLNSPKGEDAAWLRVYSSGLFG